MVLECVATGNPSPVISWSRADSKPIDIYNAKVLGNGNLIITDVNSKHGGVYLCRATTPGTRNYTTAAANITVLGTANTLVTTPLDSHSLEHFLSKVGSLVFSGFKELLFNLKCSYGYFLSKTLNKSTNCHYISIVI